MESYSTESILLPFLKFTAPNFSGLDHWIYIIGVPSFSAPLRLIQNLNQINDRLASSFKLLAGLKADLTLADESASVPDEFLGATCGNSANHSIEMIY